MTTSDREAIAQIVSEAIIAHPIQCPLGLDQSTAAQLQDMADTWRKSRTAFVIGIIGLLLTAVAGIVGFGIVARIKDIAAP